MRRVAILLAAVLAAGALRAEREYLWPEGLMPDAQPHQIAAMSRDARKRGFRADDWRRPRPHCFQRRASPDTGSCTWMGRIWEFMNHKDINR